MDIYKEIDLFDCPRCQGVGLLEEENGWCYYVMCMDCGCHTTEIEFKSDSERLEAAKTAAHLWNIGKTITDNPSE